LEIEKQINEDIANPEEQENETNQPDSTQKVDMSPYSCRQTEYKDTKRVKETMPKSPRKKAHIIKNLTQSQRTKKVLVSEGTKCLRVGTQN